MTWRLGPHHFDMHLSKAVPLSIREALLAFVERLHRDGPAAREDLRRRAQYESLGSSSFEGSARASCGTFSGPRSR